MHVPPLDYAVDDVADNAAFAAAAHDGNITLASVLERHAGAGPVTEAMFRDAWRRMESEHGLGMDALDPAGRVSVGADASGMARDMLDRTLRRFRPNA